MRCIGITDPGSLGFRPRDKNTRFFHANASSRRQRNLIEGILDEHNIWKDESEEVEAEFINYFSSLFLSSNPPTGNIEEALVYLQPKVTDDMKVMLTHVSPRKRFAMRCFK